MIIGARWHCPGIDDHRRRRFQPNLLPPVHLAVERADIFVENGRFRIVHLAGHGDDVAVADRFHRRIGHVIGANSGFVDESRMREIDQIVDQKNPVAFIPGRSRDGAPFRIADPVHVGQERPVRLFRIAHPYPHQRVLFKRRVGAEPGSVGHVFLSRNGDADSVAAEFHAVITADDILAFHRAQRQRREAVGAAILDRADLSRFRAKKCDFLAQHLPGEWRCPQLVRPTRGVPGITNKTSQSGVSWTQLIPSEE